jgi:hypothetical protein
MAVNYNINPYQAGAVVFDQKPYLAFYERQMAREQAKNDALENYFKDLNKNITSAGMRSQDVPTLLQKNKDWQEHYIQNKAAILNPKLDNGAAYSKYMNGYQDQLALANESKGAQKNAEEVGKLKFNKDFSYVFDDPNIIDDIQHDALPIGHPERKSLDVNSIVVPPKPIGTKEREEFSKYVVGEIKPDKIRGNTVDVGNFQTQTPVTHQYSDQNKIIFGQKASDIYDTDKSWRVEANKMFKELQHDPVQYQQLNNIYKRYYGNEIDSPKEAFMAKTILDHDIKSIEYEKGEDIFGREKAMEAIRHANSRDLIDYRKKIDPNDTELNNVWYESYLDKLMSDAKKSGERHHVYNPRTGKSELYYNMIKPDPFLLKSLSIGDVTPDRVGVTESGDLIPIFIKYDKDGNMIKTESGTPALHENYSQPMTREQALVNMGYRGSTKKQLKEDQQKIQSQGSAKLPVAPSGTKKYNIDGKIYTHDQLRKMYSEDKIKQYLDAGIIK